MKNLVKLLLILCITLAMSQEAFSQDWEWSISSAGTVMPTDVTTDESGNVYVTGYFTDSVNFFGSGFEVGNTYRMGYLAKVDTAGNFTWVRTFGDLSSDDEGHAVAVDGLGNVYVSGEFRVSAEFGNITLDESGSNTQGDIFIAKYSPSGDVLWAERAGWDEQDDVHDMAIDAADNIYITGYSFEGNFGGYYGITLQEDGSYIAKYSPDGEVIWAQEMDGEESAGIAVNGTDKLYTTGYFWGTVNFGNDTLTSDDWVSDIYLVQMDTSGAVQWARGYGGPDWEWGKSVAVDNENNAFIAGDFESEMILADSNFIANGFSDYYLAKINESGDFQWALSGGGTGANKGESVTVNSNGNPVITGEYNNLEDVFLAKYDGLNGNIFWSLAASGEVGSSVNGKSIHAANTGHLYVTGIHTGEAYFGNHTISGDGGMFLARAADSTFILSTNNLVGYRDNPVVYPNPATNRIKINVSQWERSDIYNINGVKVMSSNQQSVDLSAIPQGVYLIRIYTKKGIIHQKFIKQ